MAETAMYADFRIPGALAAMDQGVPQVAGLGRVSMWMKVR
jgi:hypothetical protein